MPNRIIKESICTSENLDNLTPEEEVFFYRLMVNCDDYGRADARPQILRAKCYPLKTDRIDLDDIRRWLQALEREKLIILYLVDEKQYLQFKTWDKHQQIRAKKSKFPSPDEYGNNLKSHEIKCNQVPAHVPVFGIQSYSESYSESESESYSEKDTHVVKDTHTGKETHAPSGASAQPQNQSGEQRKRAKTQRQDELFARFWAAYPKKRSKGQAEKAWAKLQLDEQLVETMLAVIERAKESEEWRKDNGRYIPYPATWLNGKRWEDDYQPQPEVKQLPRGFQTIFDA